MIYRLTKGEKMWRYLLLGMPVFSLILFFVWSFEGALLSYMLLVLLSLAAYMMITERIQPNQ
jgi:hypothetical protein